MKKFFQKLSYFKFFRINMLGLFILFFNVMLVKAQVNVGVDSYPTLKAAFDSINAGKHTGSINIWITSNTTETETSVINESGAGNASYTSITISPVGNRTIIGAIPTRNALIQLNGADSVTIDGLNTGGNSLTISNTTATLSVKSSTIMFIGDASNNKISNCSILGSSNIPNDYEGGTIYFSTGVTTGNDNNIIQNCKIGSAGSNLPTNGIFSYGSTTNDTIANSGNIIDQCEIFDWYSTNTCSGVFVSSGNSGWHITNNKLYQTAPRTSSTNMYGIRCSSTYSEIQVLGNIIGYSGPDGTGTFSVNGISNFYAISAGILPEATDTCYLCNNIISNISDSTLSGNLCLISGYSNKIELNNNQIKNIRTYGCGLTCIKIYSYSSSTCKSNQIHDIISNLKGEFYGIFQWRGNNSTINDNVLSDIEINDSLGTNSITGILGFYQDTNLTVIGNTISNIRTTSKIANSSFEIYGISAECAGAKIIRNNNVNRLSATGYAEIYGINMDLHNTTNYEISGNVINTFSGGSFIYGLYIGAPSVSGNIFNNKIHDFTTPNTTASVNGMFISKGTSNNIFNNYIGNLRTPFANATNAINGIFMIHGQTLIYNRLYNNTIYLNASSTGADFGSAAVCVTGSILTMKNNILVNISTPNGIGKTAAYLRSTTGFPNYDLSSNNNLFYAGIPDTNKVIMINTYSIYPTLAEYKAAATPRDSLSISEWPNWLSTSDTSTEYLHIDTTIATGIESGGVNVAMITDDFDSDLRQGTPGYVGSGSAPDIGADEFESSVGCNGTPVASAIIGSASICAGSETTLSLSSNYPVSGILYQWEHANNPSGPYMSLGTAPTQATGAISATTYYRCVITCSISGLSDTTEMKSITLTPVSDGGTATTPDSIICAGTQTAIYLSGYSGSMQWQSSTDGNIWENIIGADSNSLLTGNLSLSKYYRAMVKSGLCNADSSNIVLVTIDSLIVLGSISGDSIVCAGEEGVVYSVSPNPDSQHYSWILPAGVTGTSTTNSIAVNFDLSSQSGNITVKGYNVCGDGIASGLSIIVNAAVATPSITINGDNLHSNAITGNQWYDQTGLISGAINQDFLVTSNGNYYVIVTLNSCNSDPSNTIQVTNTGISSNDGNMPVNVYPNPFFNELNLESESSMNPVNFEIYNSFGQIVSKGTLLKKTTILASSLPPGVYSIKLENGKKMAIKKVTKE